MADQAKGTVAVIGAGLVGRSWAVVFARSGWKVNLTDSNAEARNAAPDLVARGLDDLKAAGLIDETKAAFARVSVVSSVDEAVPQAELVQECIVEKVEPKKELFALLDKLTKPTAILASSTSAIPASAFTADLAGRARCLVAHPVNPPHLVPIVELCGAPWTAADCVARAHAIYSAIGQVPIVINKEIEGFVLNRLQGALLTEAFRLVGEGFITPQDLDKTVKDGLGLRWSFMGPFETIDLNAPGGIADYCARFGGFYGRIADDAPGAKVWSNETVGRILELWDKPTEQQLKTRSAWRDKRIANLMAHKHGQSDR